MPHLHQTFSWRIRGSQYIFSGPPGLLHINSHNWKRKPRENDEVHVAIKGAVLSACSHCQAQESLRVRKEMMFLGWAVWEHWPGQSDHSHLKGLHRCLQRWPVNDPNTGCTPVLLDARGYTVVLTNSMGENYIFFLKSNYMTQLGTLQI